MGTAAAQHLDATSRRWLEQPRPGHPRREPAVARLHDLLLRAARHELQRRRGAPAGRPAGQELDDLAQQCADDATMSVLARLDEFRGLSRFTTRAPAETATASPVTPGIVLAYLVGKPLGIALAGRARLGTGLAAGAGFTASLLIASRAFDGALLDQAKLGVLVTALAAPALSVAALRIRRPVLATACPAR